jgi:hypothetical protein
VILEFLRFSTQTVNRSTSGSKYRSIARSPLPQHHFLRLPTPYKRLGCARSLADEPIVRLVLDGTVIRVRLDRKATAISLLVVIGVRASSFPFTTEAKSLR